MINSGKHETVVENYLNMDLGSSKGISIPMETIAVTISTEYLLGDYVKGFISEIDMRTPLRGQQIALTEAELMEYLGYLLTVRCQYVRGEKVPWQELKLLWIPSFMQFVLSLIGEVEDREFGIKVVPFMDKESKLTLQKAITISEKLAVLQDDFDLVKDALPRTPVGNQSVMSSAVIGEYVRAYRKVEHPIYTYVAALLNMKLKEETALQSLYRFQYDDINFIHAALTVHRGIF